ncbi:MAG: HDIG domain-containing protein [Myxococcales bacterium]
MHDPSPPRVAARQFRFYAMANDPKADSSKTTAAVAGPVTGKSDSAPERAPGPDERRARWLNRAANLTVLGVVGLACAYLLTPGFFAQRIPYGDDSIGQFSNTVVKATRDYDIPDEETTRRKRDEARDAILPVYDYDVTVAEAAVERLRSAFKYMRDTGRDAETRQKLAPPVDARVEAPKKAVAPAKKDEQPAQPAALPEALARVYSEHREEWQRRLETHLDDESYKAFAEARFSEEVEHEAEKLITRANGQMVADYREPLALSAGRGITVRRKSGGVVVGEKVLNDVSAIRDQNEIRVEAERWASDLAAELPASLRRALATLASREVRANLRNNREETDDRRRAASESVKPVVIQLKKGEKIIGDGERIEHRHLVIFAAIRSQTKIEDSLLVRLGGGLFAMLVVSVAYFFARSSLRRFRPTRKDALLGALTMVTSLGIINLSITIADALRDRFPQIGNETLYWAAPFAMGAMLIRFVLTSEAAVVYSIIFAGLAGVLVGNSLEFALYALLGSLVASARVARAKDRAALFRAGLYTGLVNSVAVLCFALLSSKMDGWATVVGCLAGFVGGAIAVPILVMGVTPLVEAAFGYTTDIKLLELANLNHPALKELIVQAPGTYHHSIIIGSLVEAGAEAIGANPLLARVCAYYHDIGKGKNPLYFAENQRSENRHDKLAPQMSALIIKRHVTDGMGDGPPVQAAAPGRRRHPAAPRHAARRLLLPQGAQGSGRQGRRAAGRGVALPVRRAQAADARSGAGDDRRRGRGELARDAGPDARQAAGAGPEDHQRHLRRRAARRVRPDPARPERDRPRVLPDPGRHLPHPPRLSARGHRRRRPATRPGGGQGRQDRRRARSGQARRREVRRRGEEASRPVSGAGAPQTQSLAQASRSLRRSLRSSMRASPSMPSPTKCTPAALADSRS